MQGWVGSGSGLNWLYRASTNPTMARILILPQSQPRSLPPTLTGTYQIALVAAACKKPFYVATESTKFARKFPLSQVYNV